MANTGLVLSALADPTRRAIYERLAGGEAANVRQLTETAGISQPGVTKHLGILARAGLVSGKVRGRETWYSARRDGLSPLIDWVGETSPLWRERVRRIEELLARQHG
jgi:DNA-binding transcriptional ArsR family regulator